MELTPETAARYLTRALDLMLAVAERVGDPQVNQRPLGEHTNAVAALVIHCCGVTEFWLGHVALGRENRRDREGEFSAQASVAELQVLVERVKGQVADDVSALGRGEGIDQGGRQFLPDGDVSDASVVLHVIEELYQHLGHVELAADALAR